MKTILIATDFSRASRNACIYGLHLAKAIDAKIILFSAFKISSPALGLGVIMPGSSAREETLQHLLHEKEQLSYINMPMVKTICEEGDPSEAIIKRANAEKADFIITGMKGSGKSYKKIFGTTSVSLAKHTKVPLIIVPENAKFHNLDTVIVACDDKVYADINALECLVTIAGLFGSQLNMVKVVTGRNEDSFKVSPEVRKMMQILDSPIEYLLDADITHGLNVSIQEHDADLLVMMPHHHDRLERFFIRSTTEDMIFQTHIPLLILPDNHTNYIQEDTSEILELVDSDSHGN